MTKHERFLHYLNLQIEGFEGLYHHSTDEDVREWAHDALALCKDIMERYESIHADTDIDEPEKHFYVGNKVTYEGNAHPELRGHVALITRVHPYAVNVEFIDLEDGLWPDYTFYKSDVVPF